MFHRKCAEMTYSKSLKTRNDMLQALERKNMYKYMRNLENHFQQLFFFEIVKSSLETEKYRK